MSSNRRVTGCTFKITLLYSILHVYCTVYCMFTTQYTVVQYTLSISGSDVTFAVSVDKANVFVCSMVLRIQTLICSVRGNAFRQPSKSLSETCCWQAGSHRGAITNNYSQPEGDQDCQVLWTVPTESCP